MFSYISRRGAIPICALGGMLHNYARGETASYTDASTVITSSNPMQRNSSAIPRLVDGTYKSPVITDNPNPLDDYSTSFKLDLGTPRKIRTVFVVTPTVD